MAMPQLEKKFKLKKKRRSTFYDDGPIGNREKLHRKIPDGCTLIKCSFCTLS